MSEVAIIIVNWNTGGLLAGCIESIQRLPEYDRVATVIVVDNNSHDNSIELAKKSTADDEKVSFVLSGENLGFARATNVGIRRLPKDNPAHVLLLNPDTVASPDSIAILLDSLSADERIGIVGPKLLYPNGEHQPSVRRFPTPLVMIMMFLKLQHVFPTFLPWQRYMATDFDYDQKQLVDQVMGACFLIHRDVIRDIAMLDERFWVWFEEVDYCKRAAAAQWKVQYIPESEVIHYGGASFHQLVGLAKSLPFIQSSLHYARKHFSFLSVCVLYIAMPFALVLSLAAGAQHRIMRSRNQQHL